MGQVVSSLWRRRGRILGPADLENMRLVQTPTAWQLPDGTVRIAASCRTAENVSVMQVMECDPSQDMKIVRPPQPDPTALHAIEAGGLSGFGACDATWDGETLVLAASSLVVQGRFYDTSIELMTSSDGGATFSAPRTVLTSAANGGYPVTLPCVRRLDGGGWRMWFTAFTEWLPEVHPHPDARYCIRSAQSPDGEAWTVDPDLSIPRAPGEAGLARPTILQADGTFEMWFSARGPYSAENPKLRRYRLCYARSDDGAFWQRHDDRHGFVNPPEDDDWDAQMQCYPSVLRLADGQQVMFYCGNGYGQSGFGWATREWNGA